MPAGPTHNRDVGQFQQFGPAVPFGQTQNCVNSQNQAKWHRWQFLPQFLKRHHAIRWPRPPDFPIICFEPWPTVNCKANHFKSVNRVSQRFNSQQRCRRRDKQHFVHRQLPPDRISHL